MCRFINADTSDVLTATPTELTDKNLFAYCDNNPVLRADDGGEFWHIVAGAAIGGISSFVSSMVTGSSIEDALISAAFGATSGALCAAFPGAGALIGAGFSAAESIAIDIKNHESTPDIISNAVISAEFGAIGGSSESFLTNKSTYKKASKVVKSISSLSKGNNPVVKKTAKKTVKKFTKTAAKTLAYEAFENSMMFGISHGTKKVTNNANKYLWQRVWR